MTKQTRKKGQRADVPITKEAIVDTAFRLINERGTQNFSMRALATEMGVFPATLYWHVGDRSHLLGLVNGRWVGEVLVPDETDDWRGWMKEAGRRYRAQAHRYPNVARLVTSERVRNTAALTLPDALVGKLVQLGLTNELVHAYNSLMGAVQGFVLMELAVIPEKNAQWITEAEADFRSLDSDTFPNICRNFDQLADKALSVRWSDGADVPLDESFDYLLDLLLDGLELRMAQARPR